MTSAGPMPLAFDTARHLVLAGIVVALAQSVLLIALNATLAVLPFFRPLLFAFAAASVVWAGLLYALAYRPLTGATPARAKTPTLVFAVLSIVTIGVLSGILLLLAYHTMDTAEVEARRPALPPRPAPALRSAVWTCVACGAANPAPNPRCRGCGMILGP